MLGMLGTSLGFFVGGLLGLVLGLNNFAGISLELGRLVLFGCMALAAITFIISLFSNQRAGPRL